MLIKSYNFWIRLVAVLVLLLRIIGAEFGFSVDSGLIIDIATAIASVLVVLGVIQVPVQVVSTDDSNKNNRSDYMKNFEQIKNDIELAKEKLLNLVGENEQSLSIVGILDGIFKEEVKVETSGEVREEEAQVETIVVDVEPEAAVAIEEKLIESCGGDVLPVVEDEETKSVELADSGESVEVEPVVSEETENKLNEILKTKIREILERDMDEILAQI